MSKKKLTQSEFNKLVRAWAFKTKAQATSILVTQTHGSGNLQDSVRFRQRFHKGETERIGFEFLKHGVFVQYGAGRGYVVKNGIIMKGHRASDAQIALLLQRGYALKDAKKMNFITDEEGGLNGSELNQKASDLLQSILGPCAQDLYGNIIFLPNKLFRHYY